MDRMDVRVTRLRGYLSADPSNSDLACELADALLALGEYAECETTLNALPDAARATAGVQFRLARCAMACGRYDHAESLLRELGDAGHDSASVLHDLAFAQLCLCHTDRAAATLALAMARFPDVATLHVLASRVAMMQERYEEAAAHARDALAMDANDAQAAGVLALALLDGAHADAANAARQALQLDADQHEALLVAGTLSLWTQQLDDAEALFDRALVRHPNSGRALSGRGMTTMLRNDLPRAQQFLEHAVHTMPDHIGTWHALAWAQLLQGQRDAAEASYQSAYAIDRNFGDTHGGLALIAVMRGDYAAAEQGIQRALRLDPNAFTARYARSLLLEARGDSAGADTLMEQLLANSGVPQTVPVREFAQRLKQTLRRD